MTSARKQRANSANARQSTGPKSAAGKARSAGNARRHGISQDILADPAVAEEVEALARLLTAEAGRPDLIELARRVARAHMDARRVRLYRHDQLVQAQTALAWASGLVGAPHRLDDGTAHLAVLDGLVAELRIADRYERRALSRRKFAIRDFTHARRRTTGGLWALARLHTGVTAHPRPVRAGQEPICLKQNRALLKHLRQRTRALASWQRALESRAAQIAANKKAAVPERSDREKLEAMLQQIADDSAT